ncbi:MAG: NfeD family protein [Opitutaceae bacterium]
MIDWWNNLTLEYQVFYGIGIFALLVVMTQMLMTLIGFDHDAGFDVEIGDMDHGSGIGLFSSQTLGAFFLGFGWVGVAALKSGLTTFGAGITAFIFGIIMMFAMLYMLKGLMKLQSQGNLEYENAIGEEGIVYVTIPGDNKDEGGQIQINIQGRLTTASARKITPGSIKPGERVRVTAINGPTSFVVEEI